MDEIEHFLLDEDFMTLFFYPYYPCGQGHREKFWDPGQKKYVGPIAVKTP